MKRPPQPTVINTGAEERRSIIGDLVEVARDDLWGHRDLILQLTSRNVRIRYKQAVMGVAWAILMPALIVAAGTLVRFAMVQMGGGALDMRQIAAVAVKAVPWAFFVGATGFAVTSLTGNLALVTKIYFPREALPLSATLAQGVDAAVGATAVAVALPLFGVDYTWAALWAVPILALLGAWTFGVALFVSCANLFFRDVKYLVQVLLTFGIFFTPVFFEPAMFGSTGARLLMLNPLSPMLEGLRLAVIDGHPLTAPLMAAGSNGSVALVWSPWFLVYSTGCAAGLLVTSALLFHRAEFVFAEYA